MSENNLQKNMSPINVWSLAFGCIIGSGAFFMPGDSFLPKAGPGGTIIAFVLASLIMIIIAFNYAYMINKYPIAGGEFTYTEVAFGRTNGFICSWFLGLSYLVIVSLNATALGVIAKSLIGDILRVNYLYTVAGYDVYLGELLLAIFALVLFARINILGIKVSSMVQTCMTILLMTSVILITIAAFKDYNVAINRLVPMFNPEVNSFEGILAVLVTAPFAFVGFDTIPQAAEEFNFSHKKSKFLMCASIIFGGLVYSLLTVTAAIGYPQRYNSWVEYIQDINNLENLNSLPVFSAGFELLGIMGVIMLGLAVVMAILTGINGFYMATSRLLYSLSRHKVLPKWFGVINETHSTPKNAILFIMVVSIIAPFFGRTALGWIVDMSSVGAAIGFGYTSASALKFAYQEKNKKIVFWGLLGTILSILFLILLLIPIPFFNCLLDKESYICLLVWSILGIIFYSTSKKRC